MRMTRWFLSALILALCLMAALAVHVRSGHTPDRLLDYAERRLQGHPTLEAVVSPLLGGVRSALDAPSVQDRKRQPFVIPPPPPPFPAAAAPDPAPSSTGRVLRVGPAEQVKRIGEAARLARDGDIVEIAAGDYHGDVAVWLQKKLTIRGVGGNARLHADGKSAEGKAIWVIRDGDFEISNIDFIGARVGDRNGAGIRFENGRLKVKDCLFWGNENGILTGGGGLHGGARLEVEGSEFGYNGDGLGKSHHLYAGGIAYLRIAGSYFHHGNVGHLIKSRAAVNDIRYNRLTDEGGGRASYEVDLPNGGLAVLLGNLIQQNRQSENSTLISFGREGYEHAENRLFLMSNTLVNEHPYGGAFLRVEPGAQSVVAANNLRIGRGRYHVSDELLVLNDIDAPVGDVRDGSRYDYRLTGSGRIHKYRKPLAETYEGMGLTPDAEYLHPRQIHRLIGPPTVVGALQTSAQ
jgi:hypothetical protein